MKSHKERVQEYVRKQCHVYKETPVPCPDGKDGCLVLHVKREPLELQLHHYLAVLEKDREGEFGLHSDGRLYTTNLPDVMKTVMTFSLTDGQPATEEDWELLANIINPN